MVNSHKPALVKQYLNDENEASFLFFLINNNLGLAYSSFLSQIRIYSTANHAVNAPLVPLRIIIFLHFLGGSFFPISLTSIGFTVVL